VKAFDEGAVAEDTKKFLADSGADPFPGDSEKLKALLVADTKAWAEYVKLAKIEPIS
jgi:tripartite-type tricarboxylate transporter receptor subunit TctC